MNPLEAYIILKALAKDGNKSVKSVIDALGENNKSVCVIYEYADSAEISLTSALNLLEECFQRTLVQNNTTEQQILQPMIDRMHQEYQDWVTTVAEFKSEPGESEADSMERLRKKLLARFD